MLTNLPILQIPIVDRMSSNDIFPAMVVVLALLAGTVITVTAILVHNWRRFRERRMATTLIQEMLDRNLSAAEIHQVMSIWGETADNASEETRQARPRPEIPMRPPRPAKPAV